MSLHGRDAFEDYREERWQTQQDEQAERRAQLDRIDDHNPEIHLVRMTDRRLWNILETDPLEAARALQEASLRAARESSC
jgi:hypothetical protein